MNKQKLASQSLILATAIAASSALAGHHSNKHVGDDVVDKQRAALAKNTEGKGFGPQSPRDIDMAKGNNKRLFSKAPKHSEMNLCNIHFHVGSEHKGGEFTKHAGNGDGKGHNTGYVYAGKLSPKETKDFGKPVCAGKGHSLKSGDTLELHYVHSTAQVTPGPTLGACLSDSLKNPQLRVETQVYVAVNDDKAKDFVELTAHGMKNGYHQALNIPSNTGTPITYAGSTTGPSYNEQGSPLQVTWNVRPEVVKVSIASVAKWCEGNTFNEDHGHGVRNLVTNPDLLSQIEK